MSRPVQHWPGGVPRCLLRPHPEQYLSLDRLKEEAKGWLLFVQESWVPRARSGISDDDDNNREYELHQRRSLLEQWASATQEFRDSFQNRAPIGLPGTEGKRSRSEPAEGLRYPAEALERIRDTTQSYHTQSVISLVPVDKTSSSSPVNLNRARWVKFCILLYRYDPEVGHCLDTRYGVQTEAVLNPDTTTTHSIKDFLPWATLEAADFNQIYLTHTGTVVYFGYLGPFLLVDEDGLKTGRLTIVEYTMNGDIEDSIPVRPFNMRWIHQDVSVHGKGLEELRETEGARRHQNTPIDMDLPILDILCRAQAANQLPDGPDVCDREQWEEDVEMYAPGYLALEAAGRGAEYDLNHLTMPNQQIRKRIWQRLQSGSDPRLTFVAPRRNPNFR